MSPEAVPLQEIVPPVRLEPVMPLREAMPYIQAQAEKMVDPKHSKVWFQDLFLYSWEEAKHIPSQETETVVQLMRYVAKRLVWSTINAPDNRRDFDSKQPAESIKKIMSTRRAMDVAHDMTHAMAALQRGDVDNSMTPDFNRRTSLEIARSPQALEEEMMALMFNGFSQYQFTNQHLDLDPEGPMSTFFIFWIRRNKIPSAQDLDEEDAASPYTRKLWEAFDKTQQMNQTQDPVLAFLTAFEIFNFGWIVRNNLADLRIPREEKGQQLRVEMENALHLMQRQRSPHYLALARKIYDAVKADPDRKKPEFLWDIFKDFAKPIITKIEQRKKNAADPLLNPHAQIADGQM